MNEKVVHYLFRDVFTAGYIDFMVDVMSEYQHLFIMKSMPKVFKHGIKSNKADNIRINSLAKVLYIDVDSEIYDTPGIHNAIVGCDKLIISGIFDNLSFFLKYSDEVWKKTYLHFWGGDFYCYRRENMVGAAPRKIQDKMNVLDAIRRCRAVLNVLDTDYLKLSEILGISKSHFEAPMPESVGLKIDYRKYIQENSSTDKLRVVIGNSASSDNCHIELFEKLSWMAKEVCEIICPLSYGELEYREKVIEKGKQIFGDKITFLTDFIDIDSYVNVLSGCDIGIYNNNRQQGFKNITMMLSLGKKVFLRQDTATWNKLTNLGIKVFSIDDITKCDIDCFEPLNKAVGEKNRLRIREFIESYKGQWEYVLNEKSQKILMKRQSESIGLNIHLTDHCNLNCKGCSHFAPIAEKYFISAEELSQMLKMIFARTEKIWGELCLMGGEPLLHPELVELLEISRHYCKDIPIKIITNGLKIRELDESFWDVCRRCEIVIEITCYPINFNYDEVIEYVKEKGVTVNVYVDRRDGEFRKDKLELEGNNNPAGNYARCRIGGIYPQVKNNKLFRCATAANIDILNKAFDMEFVYDETDYLQLEAIENDESVRKFLSSPSLFCRYCNLTKQQFERWEISQKKSDEWL